jgi:hypothetical protein
MPSAEYLRHQAETCLRIARSCFDLTSAERIRHLAGELKDKATEIDARRTNPTNPFGRDHGAQAANRSFTAKPRRG